MSVQLLLSHIDLRRRPWYLTIADAISRAVEERSLRAGDRLPAQRELASALGVDLTTVTRAYAEARRRGVIDAAVGRGTFVSRRADSAVPVDDRTALTDMTLIVPPQPHDPSLREMLRRGFDSVLAGVDAPTLMVYQRSGTAGQSQPAPADWLRPVLGDIDPSCILLTPGVQSAMTALMINLAAAGDTVLTEPLTSQRFRALAAHLAIRLSPVACDDEGMLPDELDAACRALSPKVIYCSPTINNPTAATMSVARRAAIADVVLRHRVPVIEDDAYGRLLSAPFPPIATSARQCTYYISTLSVCLSPGLGIAYVVCPDHASARQLEAALRATTLSPAPLLTSLVGTWIRDGAADALCQSIRRELAERNAITREILPADSFRGHPEGTHIWLTLPDRWNRLAFSAHVRRFGVALSPSDRFAVTHPPPNAVRIGIGGAFSAQRLRVALTAIADALQDETPPEFADIV